MPTFTYHRVTVALILLYGTSFPSDVVINDYKLLYGRIQAAHNEDNGNSGKLNIYPVLAYTQIYIQILEITTTGE